MSENNIIKEEKYVIERFFQRKRMNITLSFESAVDLIEKSSKIVIICAAGVSVSAKIPDFRTPVSGFHDVVKNNLDDMVKAESIFDVDYIKRAQQLI